MLSVFLQQKKKVFCNEAMHFKHIQLSTTIQQGSNVKFKEGFREVSTQTRIESGESVSDALI